MDHDGLAALWESVEARTSGDDGWDAGKAFEHIVLRGFDLEGAEVRWPYSVRWSVEYGDQEIEQVDGVVYSSGLACLCECKDYESKVNIEPIAKLRNQLLRRPSGTIGCVFSRRGFTTPASELARFLSPQTILLWSGDEICHAIRNRCFVWGLSTKFRHAVEHGFPDLDIRTV